MNKEDAYYLGRIAKTHGLKGEVSASFEMHNPEEYVGEVLFLEIKAGLVPYFVKSYKSHQDRGFIQFEGLETVEQAQKITGAGIYISQENLPDLEDGDFYFYEVVGFKAFDRELGELGEVEEIYDFKTHAVMGVQYQGKEVLIPMHEHIMDEVNMETKEVFVKLPDGLLDIYLEEGKE